MIIWSESLDRIIPLCQEFEERLIKLLWRSRPLLKTPSASSTHYHGGMSGGSSNAGHGNGSLFGYPGSGSVEALPLSHAGPKSGNGNGNNNNNGNGTLGRTSSLAFNLLHSSNNSTPSVLKGLYGEQGREFDELEMDRRDKEKVVSRFSGHLNGHGHDQKLEYGRNNKMRGGYKKTWYGKKVFVLPPLKHGDDVERYGGERRPIRLYAPVYNGLAAGIAIGMLFVYFEFFGVRIALTVFSGMTVFVGNGLRE